MCLDEDVDAVVVAVVVVVVVVRLMKPFHLSLLTTPAAADIVADSQVKYHLS